MSSHQPYLAAPVARLIQELQKLPGVGPKSAQRLTYYLIRMPSPEALSLAEAITALKEAIQYCHRCQNITEAQPCLICADPSREQGRICVVEEPLDVLALERTRTFKGLYHVLHGVLSPASGIGPEDLRIKELVARLDSSPGLEVILATNPTVEGEVTALYLYREIAPLVAKVTRLARGLPVGGDLEYADEVTLARALEERQEFR